MSTPQLDESEPRLLRVQRALDACIDRRIAGEALSDEDILAAYPDLMPELAGELEGLSVIERARRRAKPPSSADAGSIRSAAPMTGPPDFLPGYEFLGEIHRGGQAVVYRAIHRATRREVAVKVAQASVLAGVHGLDRFEREVQILGALRHPNIVTIHDSGTAAGGSFYYVMDYIEGQPLDEYVQKVERSKSRKVEITELLRLFLKVCEAVNAAQLIGVIHRDLKPANILVSADGEPHVLDFGLARLTDESDSIRNPQSAIRNLTQTGQFVGSFPWASPEQAEGSVHLDLRTDVYSLGVMLYQALTGRFPYDVTGNLSDVLNNIRHAPPAPLRRRAAGFTPALFGARGDDPSRESAGINPAARSIDDEVETIVLKCLQKAPERRYQSADELARDIRRYLAGEPLDAKRDSSWYVLRKTLRRHRAAVGVAAGFVLLLGAGLATSITLWRSALAARQEESRQRERADREAEEAIQQATVAERRRQSAERVTEFITETLAGAGPAVALGRDATMLREMMDAAAKRIQTGELKTAPEAELRLRLSVGDTYRQLAAYDAAEEMLGPAVELARSIHGDRHDEVSEALQVSATLLQYRGQAAQALPLYQESLDIRQTLFAGDHHRVALGLNDLATCLQGLGRTAEALPKFEAALEMWQRLYSGDRAETATTLNNIAACQGMLGRMAEALAKFEAALEMWQRLHPGDHPDVAMSLNNVGFYLNRMGRPAEALPKLEAASEMYQRLFPGDHTSVSSSLLNVGNCLTSLGRPAEALPRIEAALEMLQRLVPGDHPSVATGLTLGANCLSSLGRSAEALPRYEAALEMNQRLFPGDTLHVATSLNNLGKCLVTLGRPEEALPKYEASLEVWQRFADGDHPEMVTVLNNTGWCLRLLGRLAESLAKYEAALAMGKRVLPPDHLSIRYSEVGLGDVLVELNRLDEAEPLLLGGYAALPDRPGAPTTHRRRAIEALVKLYEARHAAEPRHGYAEKAAEWRARMESPSAGP